MLNSADDRAVRWLWVKAYPRIMQVTLELPDELAAEAKRRGVSVESFVQKAVEDAVESKTDFEWIGPGPYTPQQAVQNIRELSKRLTLDGIKIKDLIHEGHKY